MAFANRSTVKPATTFSSLPLGRAESDPPPAVVMGDLTLLRSLGMAHIPSVVVATDARDITLHSRYAAAHCIVPGYTGPEAERTLDALMAVGRELTATGHRKAPLFYGSDAQLAFVHAHRDALAESFAFVLNDEPLASALRDKDAFYALACKVGVRVPRTARADDPRAVRDLRAPLLVKPRAKVAWKTLQRDLFDGAGKAKAFEHADDVLQHPVIAARAADLLVQERIPGEAADLHSFHGFVDPRGELIAHFTGRKIRTYPPYAGESAFIELTRDSDVEAAGKDVIRRLGVRGVFKVDLIRDRRDSALYVLEINARFNLWNYLGAVHGVNLLQIVYEQLAFGSRPRSPLRYRPHIRWLNFYRDAKAYRDSPRRGPLTFARWMTSLALSRKVYEAFSWTDPEPFAWWLADYLRKKAR